MQEQRACNRIPCNCLTSCIVLGEPPDSPREVSSQTEMIDLSDGGMRIRTAKLEVGALVQVRISLSEHSIQIPVLTEVRWVKQKTNGLCDAGLRFLL
jgi:hypothetical protein